MAENAGTEPISARECCRCRRARCNSWRRSSYCPTLSRSFPCLWRNPVRERLKQPCLFGRRRCLLLPLHSDRSALAWSGSRRICPQSRNNHPPSERRFSSTQRRCRQRRKDQQGCLSALPFPMRCGVLQPLHRTPPKCARFPFASCFLPLGAEAWQSVSLRHLSPPRLRSPSLWSVRHKLRRIRFSRCGKPRQVLLQNG